MRIRPTTSQGATISFHRRLTAVAASAAAAVTLAAPLSGSATAAKPKAPTSRVVLNNCQNSVTGQLTRPFSARVLRAALKQVRGDLADYSGCADAIRLALRKANATVIAGARRSARGPFLKGSIAILDSRGRAADVISVKAGKRASFKVAKGTYTLRVDGRKACSLKIRPKARKTLRATVICRAATKR